MAERRPLRSARHAYGRADYLTRAARRPAEQRAPPRVDPGEAAADPAAERMQESGMLKFLGSVVGIIFLIGLLVVIGLLALIF